MSGYSSADQLVATMSSNNVDESQSGSYNDNTQHAVDETIVTSSATDTDTDNNNNTNVDVNGGSDVEITEEDNDDEVGDDDATSTEDATTDEEDDGQMGGEPNTTNEDVVHVQHQQQHEEQNNISRMSMERGLIQTSSASVATTEEMMRANIYHQTAPVAAQISSTPMEYPSMIIGARGSYDNNHISLMSSSGATATANSIGYQSHTVGPTVVTTGPTTTSTTTYEKVYAQQQQLPSAGVSMSGAISVHGANQLPTTTSSSSLMHYAQQQQQQQVMQSADQLYQSSNYISSSHHLSNPSMMMTTTSAGGYKGLSSPMTTDGDRTTTSYEQSRRQISSVIISSEYLGEQPKLDNISYVEVPMVEEVIKTIPIRTVVEVERVVPKYEYEYVDKIVEVPQIQYVDREVVTPRYEEVIRHVPVHKFVDVPREVVTTVPIVQYVTVEKTIEVPGTIIEVPRPYDVQRTVEVRQAIDREIPVIVAQTIRPIITESSEIIDVDLYEYEPQVIPVEVRVATPISSHISAVGAAHELHQVVTVPAAQYNAILRSMNSHVTNMENLPFMKDHMSGQFVSLAPHETPDFVHPIPTAAIYPMGTFNHLSATNGAAGMMVSGRGGAGVAMTAADFSRHVVTSSPTTTMTTDNLLNHHHQVSHHAGALVGSQMNLSGNSSQLMWGNVQGLNVPESQQAVTQDYTSMLNMQQQQHHHGMVHMTPPPSGMVTSHSVRGVSASPPMMQHQMQPRAEMVPMMYQQADVTQRGSTVSGGGMVDTMSRNAAPSHRSAHTGKSEGMSKHGRTGGARSSRKSGHSKVAAAAAAMDAEKKKKGGCHC